MPPFTADLRAVFTDKVSRVLDLSRPQNHVAKYRVIADYARGEYVDDLALQMAAAPTMLAALKSLSPMFDNDGPLLTVYAEEIASARAAIALASPDIK